MSQHDKSGGRSVFAAARVFDGTRALPNHAVVMENGVVVEVVPRDALSRNEPVWEEPDTTILPGLIDTHIHFMRWQGPLFLAFGVTTVRDVGNDLDWILQCRRTWPDRPWPRIFCLGPLLDGPKPLHTTLSRACPDLAGAVAAVRETAAAGVDGIKLYAGLNREWLPAMVEETHAWGLKASIHCGCPALIAARAGADEFFHLDGILAEVWPNRPKGWLQVWGAPGFADTWDQQCRVADAIRDLGITTTPTLAFWDSQWKILTPDHSQSDEMRGIPEPLIDWQSDGPPNPEKSAQWQRALAAAQKFVGLLHERGAPILAGTDVPCGPIPPGWSLWRELALLAGSGLSPEQALRSATSDAANFMGRPELGRLAAGSAADLVVVRGNPLAGIPERPSVAVVVRNGVVYRTEDLFREAAAARSGWEQDPEAINFQRHWEKKLAKAAAKG